MQLKEIYEESYQAKQAIEDENEKLKELLRMNGIPYSAKDQGVAAAFSAGTSPDSASGRGTGAYGYGRQPAQRLSPAPPVQRSVGNSPSFGATDYYGDQAGLSTRSSLHPQAAASSMLGTQPQQPRRRTSTVSQPGQSALMNEYQLGVDFVLASVPPDDGQNLGHTPPAPPHHLPSQNFPAYDTRPH